MTTTMPAPPAPLDVTDTVDVAWETSGANGRAILVRSLTDRYRVLSALSEADLLPPVLFTAPR
jgi:hypothetical protein